jgi:hypothetical protein
MRKLRGSQMVPPCGEPYTVSEVGTFMRFRVYEPDSLAAVTRARREARSLGWRVLDACAHPQPIDHEAIGLGQPTGGYVVDLRIEAAP